MSVCLYSCFSYPAFKEDLLYMGIYIYIYGHV